MQSTHPIVRTIILSLLQELIGHTGPDQASSDNCTHELSDNVGPSLHGLNFTNQEQGSGDSWIDVTAWCELVG